MKARPHPLIDHLTSRSLFKNQSELAEAAGIKPHTLSGKKGGDNVFTLSQMRRLLVVGQELGVPITPNDFFPDLELGRKSRRGRAA